MVNLLENFFSRNPEIVAKKILGCILIRNLKNKELKTKIVETEAYFDEKDPASWARFGKRKDNEAMWMNAGTILVKNVHKHKMLNFVTEKKGKASAVLIRALEPLNFKKRCNGPGLLTKALKIGKEFNGKNIFKIKELKLIDNKEKTKIVKAYRIGVVKDLKKKLRFYIKDNKYVSRK